jgi:hypothetical protein
MHIPTLTDGKVRVQELLLFIEFRVGVRLDNAKDL